MGQTPDGKIGPASSNVPKMRQAAINDSNSNPEIETSQSDIEVSGFKQKNLDLNLNGQVNGNLQ